MRAHYDGFDQTIVDAAEHVAEEYASVTAAGRRDAAFPVLLSPTMVMRVYDPNGQVAAASSNSDIAPPVDSAVLLSGTSSPPFDWLSRLAPPLISVDAGSGRFGLVTGSDGIRWRLYIRPADASGNLLLAAAPLDQIDGIVGRFRELVPLLALGGATVTMVAGWLLASRALRPVVSVTQTAAAIARSRGFDERVRAEGRRDELGQLAETFNEMLDSLEESYEAQRRFVADASHELRAPLTAIQANLELLERQISMPSEERQEAVHEASREARRLTVLVADLLTLARADAGLPLRRQPVELDQILLDAFRQARHLAAGLRIEVESIEPAIVEGDPDRLKQLLIVLLDNAVKYTPPDGSVTLALRRDDGSAHVTVRDTGVGISAGDLPHVFDRFYRADPARARDPGGTGLGLPIARWIARQHGGDVTLASTLGQGTTALLRLPVQD